MKADAQLKRDVEAELAWDPSIRAASVGVTVKDGVVTLTGHIDTYVQKAAIERAVQRVSGVEAIAVELDVRLDPNHKRSDSDIAAAAESALQWNVMVPRESIRLVVERGWVTMTGDVDWDYQRLTAANTLRNLTGVTGITDLVKLKLQPLPADVSGRIRDALARQVSRDAAGIQVGVQQHTVTLTGTVPTWQERLAAQQAAYGASGVSNVINHLRVVA